MLFVSDNAKKKIEQITEEQHLGADSFIRVTVKGGGCSGLSYQMDFESKMNPDD